MLDTPHSLPWTVKLKNRQFVCRFGQTLPIEGVNLRFVAKVPFSRRFFRKGKFLQFFQVFVAIFSFFAAKLGVPNHNMFARLNALKVASWVPTVLPATINSTYTSANHSCQFSLKEDWTKRMYWYAVVKGLNLPPCHLIGLAHYHASHFSRPVGLFLACCLEKNIIDFV